QRRDEPVYPRCRRTRERGPRPEGRGRVPPRPRNRARERGGNRVHCFVDLFGSCWASESGGEAAEARPVAGLVPAAGRRATVRQENPLLVRGDRLGAVLSKSHDGEGRAGNEALGPRSVARRGSTT